LHNLTFIVTELMAGGRAADTPIALISAGTCLDQQTILGTLETIVAQSQSANLTSPTLAIVGLVVNLHDLLQRSSPIAN